VENEAKLGFFTDPYGRGFHEKTARVKRFLLGLKPAPPIADQREAVWCPITTHSSKCFLPAQRVIFDADQREAHHSSVLPFTLTTADSPCFHPHSKDSLNPWCRLAFLIFDGCCHLSAELSRPCLQ
jgi:hypothetical protein